MAESDAERQRKTRERRKEEGYIWVGFWIKPEWKEPMRKLLKKFKSDLLEQLDKYEG